MQLYSQSRLCCTETGQCWSSQMNPLSLSIQWQQHLTQWRAQLFPEPVWLQHTEPQIITVLWIETQMHVHIQTQAETPSHRHKHIMWSTARNEPQIYLEHAIYFYAMLYYPLLRISEIFLNHCIPSASALLSLVSFPLQFPWTLPEWSFFFSYQHSLGGFKLGSCLAVSYFISHCKIERIPLNQRSKS